MKEPFRTNNRQLAFALANAGCKFAPQDKENAGPAQNLYTLAFLRANKIGVGKTMDEAVDICLRNKIVGNVTYLFVRDEVFEKAIRAWNKIHASWVEADARGEVHPVPDIAPEVVMQVLFLYANNLAKLAEVPWFNRPLLSDVTTSTKTEAIPGKPGSRKVTTGSGRIWQHRASQATKRHLKLI